MAKSVGKRFCRYLIVRIFGQSPGRNSPQVRAGIAGENASEQRWTFVGILSRFRAALSQRLHRSFGRPRTALLNSLLDDL